MIEYFQGRRKLENALKAGIKFDNHIAKAIDFGVIRGQKRAKEAACIAAAGGHNLLTLWSIQPHGRCPFRSHVMSQTTNQLPIPPDAISDTESVEIVRAWVVNGGLQCSLKIGIWEDIRCWGILLADIAKYVADAREKEGGFDTDETIALIREMFNNEIDNATCESEGDYVS